MLETEPVLIVNIVRLAVFLGLLFAFKSSLPGSLTTIALVMAAVEAMLTPFTRSQVSSNATVSALTKDIAHAQTK